MVKEPIYTEHFEIRHVWGDTYNLMVGDSSAPIDMPRQMHFATMIGGSIDFHAKVNDIPVRWLVELHDALLSVTTHNN